MNDEYKILTTLIESFLDSAKGRGENKINRSVRLKPEKIDPDYHKNTGNVTEKYQLEKAAHKCEGLGFVQLKCKPYSDEITDIILIDDKVADIEAYLEAHYPIYETRNTRETKLETLAQDYQGICPLCDFECGRILKDVENHKTKKYDSRSWSYQDEKDLLEALKFIGKNEQNLYIREAAMEIFPSSKRLGGDDGKEGQDGDKLLRHICRVCMDFLGTSKEDYEMYDEVLREFHVIKDKQKIGVKGSGVIVYEQDGRSMRVDLSPSGVELYVDELTEYKEVHIDTPVFMTVENHYSWARSEDKDVTYLDLLGFKDRTQREFLKAVYRDNPDIDYLHFGDIDASGFLIYKDLCESTGIPFKMYKMSTKELTDKRYTFNLRTLGEGEPNKLKTLLEDPRFRDTVTYMLEHNVKLEQEIISLTVWIDKTDKADN